MDNISDKSFETTDPIQQFVHIQKEMDNISNRSKESLVKMETSLHKQLKTIIKKDVDNTSLNDSLKMGTTNSSQQFKACIIKKDMDSTSSSSNESLVKMDTTNPNQQFKVRIINNYIEKIDSDLYREMTVCRKYKRWLGACYWLNVTSSTVSVVMASGSLAALMNVITSPVVLPFTCIVAVSGITTLMTNLIGNKLQRKLKKHREFVNLMEIYQFQLREEIAEALTDALISNDELKAIINIIVAYEKDKRHISKKWMWKIRLSPENNSSSSNSQSR